LAGTVSVAVQVAPRLAPPTRNTAGAASDIVAGAVVIVPDVHVRDTGTVEVLFGTKSLLTVIVDGALHPAKVIDAGLVNDAADVANARPFQLPSVMVTLEPARMVPLKVALVSVAASAVLQ